MDRFKDIPGAVLAHCTHVKGLGSFVNGDEKSRIDVILATRISEDVCRKINLGYINPDKIHLEDYKNREDSDTFFADNAGETLYRLGPAR
jgi:hypothetical protein